MLLNCELSASAFFSQSLIKVFLIYAIDICWTRRMTYFTNFLSVWALRMFMAMIGKDGSNTIPGQIYFLYWWNFCLDTWNVIFLHSNMMTWYQNLTDLKIKFHSVFSCFFQIAPKYQGMKFLCLVPEAKLTQRSYTLYRVTHTPISVALGKFCSHLPTAKCRRYRFP